MPEHFELDIRTRNGVIDFNYEELYDQLEIAIKPYETLVVVEEDIRSSKALLAKLNKFNAAIDKERKRIKKEYNQPLKEFEDEVKSLMAIVSKGVDNIKSQIKAIEERKKIGDELYSESENDAQNEQNRLITKTITLTGVQFQFDYLEEYLKAIKFDVKIEKES
jgi:hypothetical protein